MATNKVRVVKVLGTDSVLGMVQPQVNMHVYTGMGEAWYIVNVAARQETVGLSRTEGGDEIMRAYPHQLYLTEAEATADWSWPASTGVELFTHSGEYSAGQLTQATDIKMTTIQGDGDASTS